MTEMITVPYPGSVTASLGAIADETDVVLEPPRGFGQVTVSTTLL
ncbi:hypothetical protein NY546_06835 [Curtobacterium flaccumfaciens pv. flaccumfaciens]|nr:hypothetical protein [Curtobacterium flaccumfaciens]MCS5509007.1 hypothetical protein [Curtobacterium flaccumfaciens pv. flaccumfaciens]MCX2787265.1 hypothetical protein [Curtobacterium flaccumfaciens pv. flaccumfaciens]